MLKKSIPFIVISMMIPLLAMGQNAHEWQFENYVPSDTSIANTHGMDFDGEDKLWTGGYYQTTDEDGNPARALECVEADLDTPCEFSPIYRIEHEDTTFRFGMMTGVAADENGDILVSMHGHIYETGDGSFALDGSRAYIVRVDHQTGEGLDVLEITEMRDEDNSHAFHLDVDEEGYIYYSAVFPGEPIRILDPDLGTVGEVTENRAGFARTISVNAEGTKVYQPTDNGYVEIYESLIGPFGTYDLVDTTSTAGMDPGAAAVCPQTGVLYAWASGTGWSPLTDEEKWDVHTLYGFDPESDYEVVDSLTWHYGDADTTWHPIRGTAISSDGLTLAAGSFGGQGLQQYTRDELLEVSAENWVTEHPDGFVLEQNYPNPFNPTTNINFEIAESGMTTLKVYDMLGREVATLVNENLQAGTHTATFDATGLASGTYIYQLEVNGLELTRQMSFIK